MTAPLVDLARVEAEKPKWLCEFCYARLYVNHLPQSWELVWGSAVCPECQEKVGRDGGYNVVKAGAYAEVPDPRPWDLLATVTRLAEAVEEEKTLRTKEHIDLYNKYAGESQARFTADREIARLRAALASEHHGRVRFWKRHDQQGCSTCRLLAPHPTPTWDHADAMADAHLEPGDPYRAETPPGEER